MEHDRESGALGRGVLPLAIGGGVVFAIAGAYAYQLGHDHVSLIWLRCALTAGMGAAIGAVVWWSFSRFQGRSRPTAYGIAVGLGLLAWGASFHFATARWANEVQASLAAEAGPDAVDLQAPGLSDFIEFRVKTGFEHSREHRGSTGSTTLTGFFVSVAWGFELLLIAGFAVSGASLITRAPYCEACQAWTWEEPVGVLSSLNERRAKQAAKTGGLQALFDVPTAYRDPAFARFSLFACPTDTCPLWLSASVHWHDEEESGRTVPTTATVGKHTNTRPRDRIMLVLSSDPLLANSQ